jgi:hypothetical protein
MANFVHNVVLKTLQEGDYKVLWDQPINRLVRWFSPLLDRLLQCLLLTLRLRRGKYWSLTADWYDSVPTVRPCVYKLYANGHTCTGRLHDRIPYWMGSYYWLWYASRVLYSIYKGASKLVGFTADESADNYVGSTADPASRYCTGSTAGSSNCISTIANKSNQCVGFRADISSAEFGNADTTQVSYRGPRD